MGWRIAEEIQVYAPTSLTWREMYVACVLANVASETTRVCRPGLLTDEQLVKRLRIADKRELMRVIERLVEAKVIERVTRGQKGQQAEFRFLPLGPARTTQGGESAHPKTGTDGSEGGESTHPEPSSGWGFSPLRVGDSPAQGGGNPHPSQGPNEDQSTSSLLPAQRILRQAGITLGDEDEKRLIDWVNSKDRKGPAWWRTLAANGDLPGLVADWRAETGQTRRDSTSALPPWCGQCGGGNGAAAVHNRNLRFVGTGDERAPCPRCHPDAATGPRPRTGATARAIAEVDAAGEEASRIIAAMRGGHRPYQNPVDQSEYLKPIA